MKELRSKAVIVLVNSKTGDFEKMPRPVREALAKPEMGSLIPRMSVFDKDSESLIGSLAYKQLSDKKAFRALENAMKDYADGAKIAKGEDPPEETKSPGNDPEESTPSTSSPASGSTTLKDVAISDGALYEWTSTKGTKLTARATRYAGGKLTLVRENGTSIKVTLDQLDDESRKIAEELIAE
jgi:hypothetical protein